MSIRFFCSACGNTGLLPDTGAGRRAACRKCGAIVTQISLEKQTVAKQTAGTAVCIQCKAPLQEDATYCHHCGRLNKRSVPDVKRAVVTAGITRQNSVATLSQPRIEPEEIFATGPKEDEPSATIGEPVGCWGKIKKAWRATAAVLTVLAGIAAACRGILSSQYHAPTASELVGTWTGDSELDGQKIIVGFTFNAAGDGSVVAKSPDGSIMKLQLSFKWGMNQKYENGIWIEWEPNSTESFAVEQFDGKWMLLRNRARGFHLRKT